MGFFSSALRIAAPIVGGLIGAKSDESAKDATINNAAIDRDFQKEFAQFGVRWRADDAKAAGLHPLAALGVNPAHASSNPISIHGSSSLSNAFSQLGQDLSRSIQSTRTDTERAKAFADLQMENAQLQNDKLRAEKDYIASQIAKVNQAGGNPPFPMTNKVIDQPLQRVVSGTHASREPAPVTDVGYTTTKQGYAPAKSLDATQRYEDDILGNLAWNFRNRVLPTFGMGYNPPHKAPPGTYWWYNPLRQEYSLVRRSKRVYRSNRVPVFRNYN